MTLALIPAPLSLVLHDGTHHLADVLKIHPTTKAWKAIDLLREHVPCGAAEGRQPTVVFVEDGPGEKQESYHLRITKTEIVLAANCENGFLYGVQTLLQLIEQKGPQLPCLAIDDEPRFPWRGLLIDSARHYQPMDQLLALLERLARYKLNVLHWHLIDDQGWRLPVDRYPRLAEVAGFRLDKQGCRYGYVYTKDEVKVFVARASALGMMVIPEVELPGHMSAAIAAYPELSCSPGEKVVPNKWGVFKDITCAGKESTLDFYRNVFNELVTLFPAPYVHIGGDEAPKDAWRECPLCQQRIRELSLSDENALQTWMTIQAQQHLAQHGRRIIGWDELEEGGMPPGAILQHWRFPERLHGALRARHNAIISPNRYVYFDYPYDKDPTVYSKDTEKPDWMPALPTEKVYAFDPLTDDVAREHAHLILGSEATMWTEFAPPPAIDAQLFPRIIAFAERLWSAETKRDFNEFKTRLAPHLDLLEQQGTKVHRGPEAPLDWQQQLQKS